MYSHNVELYIQVDYIHVMEMTKDNMCAFVGITDMIADFKEVMRRVRPVVYYDTMFCMGDFYVSALLYRSSIFEGAPIMPLLMLIHERRTTESHELLFRWFRKLTSVTKVVLIADREATITKAVTGVLPDATVVYCLNHIIGDLNS